MCSLKGETKDQASVDGASEFYLVGKGSVAISAKALLPGKEITGQTYTSIGTAAKPLLAGVIQYRQAASGLDSEKFVSVLVVIDPTANQVLKQTEVLRTETQSSVAKNLTGSDTNAVSFHFSPLGNNEATTRAYDAMTGQMLWEKPGFTMAGVIGAVTLESVGPGVGPRGDPCYKATGIDIASGKELFSVSHLDLATFCNNFDVVWTDNGGITTGVAVGMKYVRAHATGGGLDLDYDARTGKPVTLPNQVWAVDPLSSLVVGSISHAYGDTVPIVVSDAVTGQEKITLDAERAKKLYVQVEALYNGKLYLKTTDQHLVVDIATGEITEETAKHYPLAAVGKWTYWSDGILDLTGQ